MRDPFYKTALIMTLWYVALVALTRFIGGAILWGLVLWTLVLISRKRIASAVSNYLMVLMFIVINPNICSINSTLASTALRLGLPLISIALTMSGLMRKGNLRLPLGGLLAYLMAAVISSATGWAPLISYLKMVNFLVFFLGIWFGTQNMQNNPDEVLKLRAGFFAISTFVIVGSLLLIPFPGISTLDGLIYNRNYGVHLETDEINRILKESLANGGMSLFCGVTFQSQTLAPLSAALFMWIACDMLFVEKRIRKPHLALLIVALPLIYKTRSRVGFITLAVALTFICFYLPKHIIMPRRLHEHIKRYTSVTAALIAMIAIVAEVSTGTLTRWVRKTDEVKGDNRSFMEAVTSSRQRLVDLSIEEFKRNPFFGMGFQVNYESSMYVENAKGLILSAPIEKGVAPVMILGEGGVVGAAIFLVFLFTFYVVCTRKKLYLTVALFTVLLATNLGEATIFSPGGLGGNLWMVCVVGGFIMDSALIAQRHWLLHDRRW